MKRQMKYWFMTLAVGVLLVLAGCTAKNPEDTLTVRLEQVKAQDLEAILDFVDYERLFGTEFKDGEQIPSDAAELLKNLFKGFDFKIISADTDKKTAEVTVDVMMLDMDAVVKDYYKKAVIFGMDHPKEAVESNKGEQSLAWLNELFAGDYGTIHREIVFLMEKEDGEFRVKNPEALGDLAAGNFTAGEQARTVITPDFLTGVIFEHMKSMAVDDLAEYLDIHGIVSTGLERADEIDRAYTQRIQKLLSYTVEGVEYNGSRAVVTVGLISLDLSEVLRQYAEYAIGNAEELGSLSDEEYLAALEDKFIEYMKNAEKTMTTSIELNFTVTDDMWHFQPDEDFLDAVCGGLYKALETLDSYM